MAVPNQIVNEGYPFGIFTFTYALSGVAATDAAVAAVAGLAVSQDTTAAGTVKLAADAEEIFGRIYVAENRAVLGMRVASVARKFKERLPATVGHAIAVGNHVVGAGAGLVRKVATGVPAEVTAGAGNVVIETGTDYVIVEKL